MKKLFLLILMALLLTSPCLAINLRLMTGDEQGTYYQIGREIATQTERVGIQLQVLPSEGSWSNIVALFNNDAEFAIFQVDAFLRAGQNLYRSSARNIHDDIKVVMPLYNEEIHIIKARGRELDFENRKLFTVGCGMENSGSCLSADAIAGFYGKQFRYVHDSYENALENLKDGVIDLVIITAGKPFKLLLEQDGLDLVSLPRSKKAVDIYLHTTITPDDYPWLEQSIDTYAVRSVLATMIQEEQGLANNIVGAVHFSIQVNEQKLKKNGHPKWNDVLFRGYSEDVGHEAVINSIGVCNVIKSYGYHCTDLVSGR